MEQHLINCLIIDDDPLDRLAVESQMTQFSFLRLLTACNNPLEALPLLKNQMIDLIFLDIDMPWVNGMDFFKTLAQPPLCIFVTSHPEFALEGFEANALDYILKPIRADRFEKAVLRAKEFLEIKTKAQLYEVQFEAEILTIKEGYDVVKIPVSEIVYLEALKDYTKIITEKKQYLTLANLKNFMEQLPEGKFMRIHRSYAVLVQRILKLSQNEILLQNNLHLPIGKTYREEVGNLLKLKQQK